MKDMDSGYLSINDLAIYLQIKPKTLYARVKEIPHYKVGRLIRFKREDVDAWMERHRVIKEETSRPAIEHVQKAPETRKSHRRRVGKPVTNVDRMISKAIDQVKREGYTSSHGKSDQVEGSGKEV